MNPFLKYPKVVATFQLISALAVGGCSIWYGAWYPDAQTKLHEILVAKDAKAEKPNFWTVSANGLDKSSPVVYTFLSLILGLASGAGVIVSAARLVELEGKEKAFKKEEEDHAETQRYYYMALRDLLTNFFCNQIDQFNENCRASVYRHDTEAKVARVVFRYCKISRFSQKGRVTIPEGEGVIGATLSNGDYVYIPDLPANPNSKTYSREINRQLEPYGSSIDDATLSRLRMKSRCYFGYAIRDALSGEKIAILILESTTSNSFDPIKISALLRDQQAQIANYVRHIAHLDAKLNPF